MADNLVITLSVDDKGSVKIEQFVDNVTKKTQEMATRAGAAVKRLADKFGQSALGGAMVKLGATAIAMGEKTRQSLKSIEGAVVKLKDKFTQSGLGGAITKVGGWLTSLKALAVTALTGWGIKRLAEGFLQVGAAVEKIKISLDTITKGAGETWFKKLNEWAMKMPINTEAAIRSFTTLKAMGVDPSIESMTTLIDTVSALGGGEEKMTGIARAIGQISAKGRISTEELLQMAEHGVPAMEILQEKLGVTAEELSNLRNKTISAKDGLAALFAGMEERYGGQSAKIAKSWSGLLENFISYWTEFQRLVMESGVLDWLKDKLGGIVGQLDAMAADGKLQEWAAKTGTAITGALNKIYKTGQSLLKWWHDHGEAVKVNAGRAWELAKALGQIYIAAKLFSGGGVALSWLANLGPALTTSATGAVALGTALKGLAPVLALVGAYQLGNLLGLDKVLGNVEALQAAEQAAKSETERIRSSIALVKQKYNTELAAIRETLAADRDALKKRGAEYQTYIADHQKLLKEAAETEKRLVKEVSDLYRQKYELQLSTEDQVRKLRELSMSDEERYNSQRLALEEEYTRAMAATGQERVDALEQYKSDLAGFATTWAQGVTDQTGTALVAGESVVQAAIEGLRVAGEAQQAALGEMTTAKEAQMQANRDWLAQLQASVSVAESELAALLGAMTEIDAAIRDMPKSIEVTAHDEATATINSIRARVDNLHDKTITITVRQVAISTPAGAPAAPSSDGSYATGATYVPRDGYYRLHRAEIVVPRDIAEAVRREQSGGEQAALYDAAAAVLAPDPGKPAGQLGLDGGLGGADSTLAPPRDEPATATPLNARPPVPASEPRRDNSPAAGAGGRNITTANSRTSVKQVGDLIFNFNIANATGNGTDLRVGLSRLVRDEIVPELRILGLVT